MAGLFNGGAMKRPKYPRSITSRSQKLRYTRALKSELKKDRKGGYAKRVAKGIAGGKTKQQARGHKVKEHIERAEKEKAKQGVTGSQIRSIRSFLKRFNPHGFKGVPTEEDLISLVQSQEYKTFQQYRKVWDAARKKYLCEKKAGTYIEQDWGYLVDLTTYATVRPKGEEQWLYYH